MSSADPNGTHSWAAICRCCGIERRRRASGSGFVYYEYLVDGAWTTKRPDCRVIAADKEASRG